MYRQECALQYFGLILDFISFYADHLWRLWEIVSLLNERPLCFIVMVEIIDDIQTARQDELITELEEDLEESQSKLRLMEKELEMWKDKVRRLTEASFAPGSGISSAFIFFGYCH